ncbi:hypothetical protein [Nonomuraea sp. NPDC003214]
MDDGRERRLVELRAAYPKWWITTSLVWGAAAWRRQDLDAEGVSRGLVNVLLASDLEALAVQLASQTITEGKAALPGDGPGVSRGA